MAEVVHRVEYEQQGSAFLDPHHDSNIALSCRELEAEHKMAAHSASTVVRWMAAAAAELGKRTWAH